MTAPDPLLEEEAFSVAEDARYDVDLLGDDQMAADEAVVQAATRFRRAAGDAGLEGIVATWVSTGLVPSELAESLSALIAATHDAEVTTRAYGMAEERV